ncbi:MAG: hypothetical protein ACREPB_04245 [Arenimonas sp.]
MSNNTIAADAAKQGSNGPGEAEGFSFLDGHWRVHHKKLKEPLTDKEEWIEFEGTASFFSLLDGIVSVEELRDAKGAPFGSAMRTFDIKRRIWLDAWVSAGSGVLQSPIEGRFEGDVGTFIAPDSYEGKTILARGVWRRISENEVTWEQATSMDDGKTWEDNWFMRFERTVEKTVSGK